MLAASMVRRRFLWIAVALLILPAFVLIPRFGVQQDEALFAPGTYGRIQIESRWGDVPVMLMSYVGALKAWLYTPWFAVWNPSPFSLRIPAVGMAVAAVILFWLALRRLAGPAAATAGALLLTADTSFLLTTTLDWGPVALQLLLSGAAAFLLLQGRFGWAGLLLGLALWNKAIFLWFLAPAAPLLLNIRPRRRLLILALAVTAGASPLLWYNVTHGWRTFRENGSLSAQYLLYRAGVARDTLDGPALLGYLVPDDPSPFPRRSLLVPALLLAIAWLAWRRKHLRLVAVASGYAAAVWLLMCLSGGGWSAHHVVLLWPVPHLMIALALGDLFAARPRLAIAALTVLVLSSLAVTARYIDLTIRSGPAQVWTDAIYPLTTTLTAAQPREVVVVDWGISHPVLLLSAGRLPIVIGNEALLRDDAPPTERDLLRQRIASPDVVFVSHPDGAEVHRRVNQRLWDAAASLGYRKQPLQLVADSHGRPTFEIFRFAPIARE